MNENKTEDNLEHGSSNGGLQTRMKKSSDENILEAAMVLA